MSRRVPSAKARKSWLSDSSLSFEVQPCGCTLVSSDHFRKAILKHTHPYTAHREDLDVPAATFACPDLTTFCRLEEKVPARWPS